MTSKASGDPEDPRRANLMHDKVTKLYLPCVCGPWVGMCRIVAKAAPEIGST